MRLFLLLALVLPVLTQAQDTEDPDTFIGLGFFFVTDIEGRTIVTGVAEDGAAIAAGLRPGDILLTIDGEDVPPFNGVFDMLAVARENPPVLATVERDGESMELALGVGPYTGSALERAAHDYLCQSGDCWDGEGVWRHPDGQGYAGRFKGGVRKGYGVFSWPNGGVYTGAHANDTLHGYGAYMWPNGWSWRGRWKTNEGIEGAYYTPVGEFHHEASFDQLFEPSVE